MAQPAQIFREQRWSRREATARRHLMPPTGSAGAARHRLDGGKIMSKPTSAPSGPSDDRLQYPVEVLNRAARVFGVGGYMLGEHQGGRLYARRAPSPSPRPHRLPRG